MLRFFSKMRYQLASENRVVKYLRYAIGEILLVVIGILIAVQINNWNGYHKDQKTEHQYLLNFVEDMRSDSSNLAYFTRVYPPKIDALLLARTNAMHGVEIKDTLEFITRMGFAGVASKAPIFETQSTYDDIISTGNLRLIRNSDLREQILDYYQLGENTESYLSRLRTDYSNFMNSYAPYDPRGTFKLDRQGMLFALDAIKTHEFMRLANAELTFAYAFRQRIDRLTERNRKILDILYSELNKTP